MVAANRCYVIAEAGVNHNGSLQAALELVNVAADAGADAVKFQTFIPELLVSSSAATVEYQRTSTGVDDQLSMLKSLVLERGFHPALIQRCKDKSIAFLSTAFDESSAQFLIDLGMLCIKIPSGEITNLPFLEFLVAKRLPVILSTGMSTLEEVQCAVNLIQTIQKKFEIDSARLPELTVLHCTSNYPTRLEDVNLLAMKTMHDTLSVPVGYSDHTLSTLIAPVAVGMGATVIEKHFTLSREQEGPDHSASLEPMELGSMIKAIREVESALGSAIKAPCSTEIEVRDLVRRSITSARDIDCGEKLVKADLLLLRPGLGIPPFDLENVIGKTAVKKIKAGTLIEWSDLK